MQRPFDPIRHIPHFYLIRMVESRLLSQFLKDASPPFLDLGCGDGEFARSLGLKQVYGIDIDDAALSRVTKDGYYSDVQNAKASAIPYPDEFFGAVFSNCAVEHMDDLLEVLCEVRRVLVKGGEFVFTVPRPEFFEIVKKDQVLINAGVADDEVIAEYNLVHHHVNIFDIGEWSVLLKSAGFEVKSHAPYLPGAFGRFVARMDMLYTIDKVGTKQLISKFEKKYVSLSGMFFKWRINQYLKNPQAADTGTHQIINAKKV